MDYSTLAPDYVRAIAPYIPGKPSSEVARELGLNPADIVKLASNENPLGCSPRAKEAMVKALEDIHIYPDGSCYDLRNTLSRRHDVPLDGVLVGNGSNDVLEYLAMAFLARELTVVFSQYCFAVYPLATQARGATGIKVLARDFGNDLQAIRAAILPSTKLVYLANPNNPTGTFTPYAEIKAFLQSMPANVIVCLDEAYNEYLPKELRFDTTPWLKEFPNLVISRTFAKIYGLAGLRIGYALTNPQIADMVNRVRAPFNVNSVAQAAALAALHDQDFVERAYQNNRAGMAQLEAGSKQLGLSFIPSFANFLTIQVAQTGARGAAINAALLKRGVTVRPLAGYELPTYLRVTIGTPIENSKFLAALEAALAETKASPCSSDS